MLGKKTILVVEWRKSKVFLMGYYWEGLILVLLDPSHLLATELNGTQEILRIF